ncbi:spore coat protein [Virgibacillus phasianinus]|uniref:Spore coat protein n=1 Tax=Virgibacillus phasianinus TaxID=2017483 RepID=A0A220U804_9BACI|nr:spore coat protein [Virgibacillus phasianinus]
MVDRYSKPRYDDKCDECYRSESDYDSCDNRYESEWDYDSCDKCHNSDHCCDSCYQKFEHDEKCNKWCEEPKKWSALDPTSHHPFDTDATVEQDADATLNNVQESVECIVIKDSCDVEVSTTDTQAALNVQVALQVAIAIVISISIADSTQADEVTQDLYAKLKSAQVNKQQVYIENSRGVNVATTDTDIAVNIQILLQILIALVVRLDVL